MKKAIRILMIFTVILSVLAMLAACSPETEPTPTSTPATSTPSSPAPTQAGPANWWDEYGEPQYGGEIVLSLNTLEGLSFDPQNAFFNSTHQLWTEKLFMNDWTLDRGIWSFTTDFASAEYQIGMLAESWEQTDLETITVHLRKGIYWQDIEPVNGRPFTAADVQYTYDRVLGTGSGFTEPNPFCAMMIPSIAKVTAMDDYTLEVKYKFPTAVGIYDLFSGFINIVAPECVEMYGNDLANIGYAVGTGAWMVSEYEPSVSISYDKNPNYWGEDERHPGSKLPYADTLRILAIPDSATLRTAIRTGQIDMIFSTSSGFSYQDAVVMAETNPEIQQSVITGAQNGLCLRCDHEPFTNINVRKALQMAINLPEIAENYYGGTIEWTPAGLINPSFTGWTTPYAEWPAELQAEYGYDPEAARELLAGAGYADGFDTSCSAGAFSDLDLLQVVKSELEEVGINMEIEVVGDPALYYNFIQNGGHEQMCITSQLSSPDKPFNAIKNRVTGNMVNFTRCDDPAYDALVEAVSSSTSLEDVMAGCTAADMYSIEQHWTVRLLTTVTPVIWQPYVKGYTGELLFSSAQMTQYTARWWVDPDLKASMGQ